MAVQPGNHRVLGTVGRASVPASRLFRPARPATRPVDELRPSRSAESRPALLILDQEIDSRTTGRTVIFTVRHRRIHELSGLSPRKSSYPSPSACLFPFACRHRSFCHCQLVDSRIYTPTNGQFRPPCFSSKRGRESALLRRPPSVE